MASSCMQVWHGRSTTRPAFGSVVSRLAEKSYPRHSDDHTEKKIIIITQPNATEEQLQRIVTRVREFGLEAQISRGASRVIIGVIGPEALLREKAIAAMQGRSEERHVGK